MKKQKDKRKLNSLRTQLPLSYASIALITTTLIGAVLLFIIWNYYHGLEEKYLNSNLHGTANSLTRIVEENDINDPKLLKDYSDVFQNQANITAFLIQSRMRVLDIDGNVVADSGTPSRSWSITIPRPKNDGTQQPSQTGTTSEERPSFSIEKSGQNYEGNPPPYSIQANPNMFGFLLEDSMNEEGKRSSVVAKEAFYGEEGIMLGYVELSEGPGYGQRIILNVLKGWAIASLIGLIVSVTFGWIMSRKLTKPLVELEKVAAEMKDGNYEIRSPILEPAELASLSGTFNQMAAHIQQSIETLRQFVSDAAHEIRTPLTSLRADLNLALSEKTAERSKPIVERSLEQVDRLDQLSRDLLDLSKLESRNTVERIEKIDLADLLAELSEVHASAAEQAGITFQLQFPSRKVYVHGDKSQLYRAVGNLLDNAVKFTPVGGKVILALRKWNGAAQITVEDTGIGIPSDEREMLFKRFHRGKNTQRYPGSGLGLAIAKTIVENHQGEIGISPDPERTIFFIRLPLVQGTKDND
ncbi:MAG: HAMP domain-containing histidine kinase [Pelolinea sp.]|jgi:signal transduction histidine kinase|nr:HAMP domain-containing histidine kinase [Pelolinea sp.]